MNESSEPQRALRLEVTRESRVRKFGRYGAPLAGVPLVLMGLASWLLDPNLRGLWGVLAFSIGCAAAFFVLFLPQLCAFALRARHKGPLGVLSDRRELSLVTVNGRRRWSVPLNEIGVVWQRGPQMIELTTASGDEASLAFASRQEAAAVVRMVHAWARDRRAYPLSLEHDSARIWRECLAWFAPSVVAMMLLVAAGPIAWPAAPAALLLAWLVSGRKRRIVLGADGVVIEGRWRRRYVAYRTIVRVELSSIVPGTRTLALRLEDGRRVSLGSMLGKKRAELAHALLVEGIRMVESGEAAGANVGALEPSADESQWRLRMYGAAKKQDYRGAALDVDRLVSIVRNPAAEAAQRIAAALAVRAEPAGIARLRVAAGVSTEPEVREALEALAEDRLDEHRVHRALLRVRR